MLAMAPSAATRATAFQKSLTPIAGEFAIVPPYREVRSDIGFQLAEFLDLCSERLFYRRPGSGRSPRA